MFAPVARSIASAGNCSNIERIGPRGCRTPSGPPRCRDHAGIVPLLVEIVGEPAPLFGGAPNPALTQPSELLLLSARISPRSPKQSHACPSEGLTSKGWMP